MPPHARSRVWSRRRRACGSEGRRAGSWSTWPDAAGVRDPGGRGPPPFEAPQGAPVRGLRDQRAPPRRRASRPRSTTSNPSRRPFLVLDGELIAIIEGEERRLRRWDFVHCPAGVAHAFVGAGEHGGVPPPRGGLAAARPGDPYPRDVVAAEHGASRSSRPPTTAARRTGGRAGRGAADHPPPPRCPGRPRQLTARAQSRRQVAAAARPRRAPAPASRPSPRARRAARAAVSGGASGSACAACTRSTPRLPVGLEVDARDEPVPEQERQHVVAVHPLAAPGT